MEPAIDLGLSVNVQLIILAFSLLAVAFFSSSEASLISVNKIRIKHLVEQGNPAAKAVLNVVERHEKFFATILLTENAFIILASSVGTAFAISLLGGGASSVLVATVVMTLLVVIFGEITPKSLAARASERWSLVVGRPVQLIMALETPVIFIFTVLPRLMGKLLGGGGGLGAVTVTEGELRMMIDIAHSEGMVESEQAERLESVFRFADQQVSEVMTPRTEIVSVEWGVTLREFLDIYVRYPHTRFPVFKGSSDNIVGVLSAKDILNAMSSKGIAYDEPVTDVIRDAPFIPETKLIDELFEELRRSGNQMAIAIDEYGGIAGLLTLKRLLEEEVGRVGEEGASPEVEYEALGENTFQIDGGMSVHEANTQLGIRLAEGDFETVAGFVLGVLGHIPARGERFEHGDLKVEVTEMKDLKIETVTITKMPRRQADP